MPFILLLVAAATSIIGSICGVGGGILIKPILDASGALSVSAISFLSGCTVLVMSITSLLKKLYEKTIQINRKTTPALGAGSALGGVVGKSLFDYMKMRTGNEAMIGLVQTLLLGAVVGGTFLYMVKKETIKTHQITNVYISASIGVALGVLSSFLGVGGGPINIAVLSYCFSANTKEAATNSLCIIVFSQTASLIQALTVGALQHVQASHVLCMMIGGIAGGLIGQHLNKKMDSKQVEKLFNAFMIAVIGVCVYNSVRFALLL